MAVRGIFMSNASIAGDRQNTLSGRVLMNGYGGTAPLLALSSGMPEERISETAWSWTEDQHISGNTTCPAGATNVATSITVADSNIWVKNGIVLVESTGEHIFITDIVGNVVTAVRGIAGTTPTAIAANARMQLIGTAYEEAGGKPPSVSQLGETYTNIAQIFKNGWSISGTAKAITYTTGNKLAHNREMCAQYHAEDIERSFIWGKRGQNIIGGKEFRMSNGIINMINQYGGLVQSAAQGSVAGNMAISGLTNFMRKIYDRRVKGMPNERIAFTSSSVIELVNNMARLDSHVEITVSTTTFGFNIVNLSFMGNDLKLMSHPLMVENALWQSQLYVLHPGLIKKKILRSTWTEEFTQGKSNNNGIDADEGYIADEMGFHLGGAKCMGYMTNIVNAVAS